MSDSADLEGEPTVPRQSRRVSTVVYPPPPGPPRPGAQPRAPRNRSTAASPVDGQRDPLVERRRLRSVLEALQAELVEMETSPSFLMLTSGSLGMETERAVGSTMAEVNVLWPLLHGARSELTLLDELGDGRTVGREIQERLTQPMVTVAAGPNTPARQMLLGDALDRARALLVPIEEAVARVDTMWLELLPRLDGSKRTLARLRDEAARLGVTEPLIGRAQALATDLEERLVSDPFGIHPNDPANLDEQVALAAEQIASLRSGHDGLETDMASTEALLAELRGLRAAADAARLASLEKIKEPAGLVRIPAPSVIDGTRGLADRLDDLFDDAVPWMHRRTMLDQVRSSADRLHRQLERAEAANRGPIDKRNELRGRLTAFQAKMAAVGQGENQELTELADLARAELYTSPVDLDIAEALVDDLAQGIRREATA